MRAFTLTLHFYSPASYEYLRNVFNNYLSHLGTKRKWYTIVDDNPGFTFEFLIAIKSKVKKMASKNKLLVCGLMMDEMLIREDVHCNEKRL